MLIKKQLSLPTAQEAALAKKTRHKLTAVFKNQTTIPVNFGDDAETVELPVIALRLLIDILEQIAEGNAVTLTPIPLELTIQEAADLLNVSHSHLVQLLDNGEISYRKEGSCRQILAQDILEYRRQNEKKRRDALDELTAYDQELGFQ